MTDHAAQAACPEKQWIGRSFTAAASGYDGVAGLQRAVGHDLLSRAALARMPEVMVDVGVGTGYFAAELAGLYPSSRLVMLDLAEGMLQVARARLPGVGCCVCGDAEALPLADRSADLIFSNLAIQWCPNLAGVFGEFRRVLKPGGTLLFSTFGAATLSELRAAWAKVDAYTHVNDFIAYDGIAAALREAGFRQAALEVETRALEYPDPLALMRELKGLGAHNITAGRRRHLTGKGAWRGMLDTYQAEAGTEKGDVRATFEVIYGRVGGDCYGR